MSCSTLTLKIKGQTYINKVCSLHHYPELTFCSLLFTTNRILGRNIINHYCQWSHWSAYKENPSFVGSPFLHVHVLCTTCMGEVPKVQVERPRTKPEGVVAAQALVNQPQQLQAMGEVPDDQPTANLPPLEQLEISYFICAQFSLFLQYSQSCFPFLICTSSLSLFVLFFACLRLQLGFLIWGFHLLFAM